MPVYSDFSFNQFADGTISVSLAPAANIGNQNIRFQAFKRFGGISGLITKSCNSGFNNVSGINITSSGEGRFNISLRGADTSGLQLGNYAYAIERLDSGSRTVISEGYLILLPGGIG